MCVVVYVCVVHVRVRVCVCVFGQRMCVYVCVSFCPFKTPEAFIDTE